MRKTKINIDKPIIFIDTAYNQVLWFTNITGNKITGFVLDKKSIKLDSGHWDKHPWEKFIKDEKMDRFKQIGDTKLFPGEGQKIIMDIFFDKKWLLNI